MKVTGAIVISNWSVDSEGLECSWNALHPAIMNTASINGLEWEMTTLCSPEFQRKDIIRRDPETGKSARKYKIDNLPSKSNCTLHVSSLSPINGYPSNFMSRTIAFFSPPNGNRKKKMLGDPHKNGKHSRVYIVLPLAVAGCILCCFLYKAFVRRLCKSMMYMALSPDNRITDSEKELELESMLEEEQLYVDSDLSEY